MPLSALSCADRPVGRSTCTGHRRNRQPATFGRAPAHRGAPAGRRTVADRTGMHPAGARRQRRRPALGTRGASAGAGRAASDPAHRVQRSGQSPDLPAWPESGLRCGSKARVHPDAASADRVAGGRGACQGRRYCNCRTRIGCLAGKRNGPGRLDRNRGRNPFRHRQRAVSQRSGAAEAIHPRGGQIQSAPVPGRRRPGPAP